MLRFVFRAFIMSLVLYGCNPKNSQPGENDFTADPNHPSSLIDEGKIIYSLNIPTDIVSFFEETGTGFDPDVTCPLERIPMYENPEHIAILLGVLGVDLSYCTLFERLPESAARVPRHGSAALALALLAAAAGAVWYVTRLGGGG